MCRRAAPLDELVFVDARLASPGEVRSTGRACGNVAHFMCVQWAPLRPAPLQRLALEAVRCSHRIGAMSCTAALWALPGSKPARSSAPPPPFRPLQGGPAPGADAEAEEERIAVRGSYGTKLEAVVARLLRLTRADAEARVLVFSTWADVLDLVRWGLCCKESQRKEKGDVHPSPAAPFTRQMPGLCCSPCWRAVPSPAADGAGESVCCCSM